MNRVLSIFTLLMISLTVMTSCTKKEPPQPPPPEQETKMHGSGMMEGKPGHADIQMPSASEMKVLIPEDVKARWKGIVLTVIDREKMDARDYSVPLKGRLAIPGSRIEVQVDEFLPDLKIDGNIYTTETTDLLNPAIHVFISEDGKELFKGWLFQKFPSVHPFKHNRFGITLKEPLEKL